MQVRAHSGDIRFPNYRALDSAMDNAFCDLLTASAAEPVKDFTELESAHLPQFEREMFRFFSQNPRDTSLQDDLFTNLTHIWMRYLEKGRLSDGQALWSRILHKTTEWEQSQGIRIHKGSALYFWGVTAIIQGELDKGFFLMHSAFQEDVLTQNKLLPQTPAFMFVTLDHQDTRQFFYGFVKALADHLTTFFPLYQLSRGSNLDLDEFQNRFLRRPPSIHAVFSFTHSLSKLWFLSKLPTFALQGDFAGQFELNVLFDLILVVDKALKYKHPVPGTWRYLELADCLATKAGLGISKTDLIDANNRADTDLDQTIADLANGVFQFSDGNSRHRLACDLTLSYILRNYAAHNLSSFPSIWQYFDSLRQAVMSVLFLTVDEMY